MPAPRELGFFQPIETNLHEATLLAWPAAHDLWVRGAPIAAAREGFVALARGIADVDAPRAGLGEQLWVLVPTAAEETVARAALAGLPVRFFRIPYGDIWLRDIAPDLPASRRRSAGDGGVSLQRLGRQVRARTR